MKKDRSNFIKTSNVLIILYAYYLIIGYVIFTYKTSAKKYFEVS